MTKLLAALAVALATFCVPVQPAHAVVGALAFTGTWHSDCFGCGPASGSADLCVTGAAAGRTLVCGSVYAQFTSSEPGGLLCLVSGTASGYASGAGVEFDFNWTRLGALVFLTTSGDIVGMGMATFLATTVTCGAPMAATVAGAVSGLSTINVATVDLNDGETAVLALTAVDELAFLGGGSRVAAPNGHDLQATCTAKVARAAPLASTITVAGRTHTGRHPTAASATIRCRVLDAGGAVLFDQTRTEPGTQARIEGTVSSAPPGRVTVCTLGEGMWGDGHAVVLGLACQAG